MNAHFFVNKIRQIKGCQQTLTNFFVRFILLNYISIYLFHESSRYGSYCVQNGFWLVKANVDNVYLCLLRNNGGNGQTDTQTSRRDNVSRYL